MTAAAALLAATAMASDLATMRAAATRLVATAVASVPAVTPATAYVLSVGHAVRIRAVDTSAARLEQRIRIVGDGADQFLRLNQVIVAPVIGHPRYETTGNLYTVAVPIDAVPV